MAFRSIFNAALNMDAPALRANAVFSQAHGGSCNTIRRA